MNEAAPPSVTLKLTDTDDRDIIRNLWPLYQHEVSAFHGEPPNAYGLFGADDNVRTLAQHLDSLDPWWREPQDLFPYLIRVDGRPAGFHLIATPARVGVAEELDFVCLEFFVLHCYRGTGAAAEAAKQGFELHAGEWEVVTWPGHGRAIRFWQKVISEYSGAPCPGQPMDHPFGSRHGFRFNNSLKANGARQQTVSGHERSFEKVPKVRRGESITVQRFDDNHPGWFFGTTVEGTSGFFPRLWFHFTSDAKTAEALRDYTATELTVAPGSTVEVMEEVAGWVFCRDQNGENNNGEEGWLPRRVFFA